MARRPRALAVQTEALRSECARTEKALAAAKEALTLAQKQYTRALQFEQCQKAETDAEAQLKTAETRAASAKAQYTRAEQNRAGLTKLTAEKDTLLKRSEQLRAEQERSLQKEQLLKNCAPRRSASAPCRSRQRTTAKSCRRCCGASRRRSIHRKGRCRKRPARVALTDADHLKRTACRAENAQ